MGVSDNPAVAILLATCNGERFLAAQLDSIASQSWPRIDIWASDDGSTDSTREILDRFASSWSRGKFIIIDGPRLGRAAANFRQLILRADAGYRFVAFADQDDVWLATKLERAIGALAAFKDELPRVHCSRTRLIDAMGREVGHSPAFRRPPGFRNALVQSLAGGNTMVLNHTAFMLLRQASERTGYVAHDWWTYQIVSAAGGEMLYSPVADTLYRQHGANEVGTNQGLGPQWQRLRAVAGGRYRAWNGANLDALGKCLELMTSESRETMAVFERARAGSALDRVAALRRSGVYRQTAAGQAMLYAAAAAGLL